MKISALVKKWLRSPQDRLGLDILLGQAPETNAPLRLRLDWIEKLVNWVRTVGPELTEDTSNPSRIQIARLRYILLVLDRNLALKKQVAETLRSIIHETRALELFMNVGIPNHHGFMGELVERLSLRYLPQPPNDHDLVTIFSETFRLESDAEWIKQMEPDLFEGWLKLFSYSDTRVDPGWNTLIQDARDALYLLSHAARSTGLSRLVRNRVADGDFRRLPFFELSEAAENLLHAQTLDEPSRVQAWSHLNQVIERCLATLTDVYGHFRLHGVSITLVYQIERLRALLQRVSTLSILIAGYQNDAQVIQNFFGLLVQENIRARSVKGLLQDNLTLVSQKIVETNAETGEHYITRDRDEYFGIIKKSWGGGAVTGITTLFKYLIANLSLAPFITGLCGFANYAICFVGMQFAGFTLATKQPAMTATVLASKIQESNNSVEPLIDEIVHLIRSQLATVFGNLTSVIPAVILIDLMLSVFGTHLTDAEHGKHVIESFSVFGATPIYAAWTGVLLWASSVFAGWFGNWFSYRGLPEAIEHHRRLQYVLGAHRLKRIATYLKNTSAAFAASISLGFLLGMMPMIAGFFGIPLEVRHVTLSSGALTGAAMSVGASVFSQTSFWLAIGGIFSMSVLNIGVAFSLALTVALWAKKSPAPKREHVYRALVKRFMTQPLTFFIPARKLTLLKD